VEQLVLELVVQGTRGLASARVGVKEAAPMLSMAVVLGPQMQVAAAFS
jgi:hypothetical protein